MIALVLVFAFVALCSAVSRQCGPDGSGECPVQTFCVETKFCLPDGALNDPGLLFVAGVASEFVPTDDAQDAQCLVDITAEISAFLQALDQWYAGNYVESGEELLQAVTNFQQSIATCVTGDDRVGGSFWDELWDGVKYVVDALCPECGVVITDAEFVIAGVDIIEDWVQMYENCMGDPTPEQLMDCGVAFGDSVQRIASAARAEVIGAEQE